MNKFKYREFYQLIEPILSNEDFVRLKDMNHHGITRYDHSLRVAYYTFLITSFFHLNYEEATIAALLHDYFTDEVEGENSFNRLIKHPNYAVENAKKIVSLSEFQEDIIRCHMFPITFRPPKYLEGWIVDLVDDTSAIYEKVTTTKEKFSTTISFLFILLFRFFQ